MDRQGVAWPTRLSEARPGRALAAGTMDVSRSGAKELFCVLDARRRRLEEEVAWPELQPGSEGFVQAGPRGGGDGRKGGAAPQPRCRPPERLPGHTKEAG